MGTNNFALGENERIVKTVYKHWMSIAPFIFVSIALTLLCLFGVYYIALNQPSLGSSTNSALAILAIFAFLALIGIFTFGVIWIWHSNRVVMTNENIIDMDQLGLFRRNVATLSLANIQDVSINVNGPIQTILQFGTIIVQTAGERENFHLDFVPHPYEIEQVIIKLHKDFRKDNPETNPLGKLTG
ncbi:MAG: PH domain-containing protein [bacterium]|nr:PH domain-containing protein [bacterium]